MARPCPACMAAIKDFGIKNIYYTTDDGMAYENVSQLEAEYGYSEYMQYGCSN